MSRQPNNTPNPSDVAASNAANQIATELERRDSMKFLERIQRIAVSPSSAFSFAEPRLVRRPSQADADAATPNPRP